MTRHPGAVPAGRGAPLAALRGDGVAGLAVVRGARGSGRTVVIEHLARDLAAGGAVVLRLSLGGSGAGGAEHGVSGVRAFLDAVCERVEDLDAGSGLFARVDAVRRTLATAGEGRTGQGRTGEGRTGGGRAADDRAAGGRVADGSAARGTALLAEVGRLVAALGRRRRVVVTADDADAVDRPAPLLEIVRAAGHLVLCSVTDEPSPGPGTRALLDRADRVVDLPALDEAQVDELLTALTRHGADPVLHAALRRDLGPLAGHPATLVATVADLRERRRLLTVARRLALCDPAERLRLPPTHPAVDVVEGAGPASWEVTALAADTPGPTLDDVARLAELRGETDAVCGRTVDELVARGVLTYHAGTLALPVPALGVTARRRVGTERLRRLRAAVVTRTEPDVVARVVPAVPVAARDVAFSDVERAIVELVGRGRTNRQIATTLGTCQKTVENHLTRLYVAVGCRGRHGLALARLDGSLDTHLGGA